MKFLKEIFDLIKEAFQEWQADKASRWAAGLAYYAVFSLAPLLIITIALVGLFFGESAARNEVVAQLQDTVGKEAASLIQQAINNAAQPTSGTLASIVGIIAIFFAASGLFGALQDALNVIWGVEDEIKPGLMGILQQRLLQFVMIFIIGALLLLSLATSIIIPALTTYLHLSSFLQIINLLVSFAMTTLLFALIYKILPEAHITWSDVWIGALVTSFLFTLGKWLIGLYLGSSNVGSAYGAAGSLLILLVWIYYSAQILLFGAEFTYIYAYKHGSLKKEAPPESESQN